MKHHLIVITLVSNSYHEKELFINHIFDNNDEV